VADDTEHRVKHLEMLQGIISRLSQHSFIVRGWSVTLVSLVVAILSAKDTPADLVLLALAPAWIFWGLDGYYLHLERRYRQLFRAAAHRLQDPTATDVAPFDMNPGGRAAGGPAWPVLFSPTVAAVPVMLTAVIIGAWAITR
jgi:hypothetical protein